MVYQIKTNNLEIYHLSQWYVIQGLHLRFSEAPISNKIMAGRLKNMQDNFMGNRVFLAIPSHINTAAVVPHNGRDSF